MHNRINALKKIDGTRVETHKDIEKELVSFYKYLLSENNISRDASINQVVNHIPSLITKEHIETLIQPITLQEVEVVFNQID